MEQHVYREQFELEDTHWWFAGRRGVIWALLRRAGVGDQLRVLDAGCGTGRNLVEFGTLGAAEGVDSSAEALEFCRRRGLQAVRQGSLESLPFDEASFDLVLAADVIEHIEDDHAALAELRRVTAPGGLLMATVPAYRWLWSHHDETHHHFRRYTSGVLRERLRAAGWQPVAWSYFNTALLPPIAVVRLLARVRPARDTERLDFDLTPAPLNRLLEQPMRWEARLIGRGVRLPAGVSIGVVAAAAPPSRA